MRARIPVEPLRPVFGSCRVTLPHKPPYTLSKDRDDRDRQLNALLELVAPETERLIQRTPRERRREPTRRLEACGQLMRAASMQRSSVRAP
jgi:hypothetical protein